MFFVFRDSPHAEEPITSMPGVSRYGYETLIQKLKPLVENGLKSILIFGVTSKSPKDEIGTSADCADNPVIKVLPLLREKFPDLLLTCDVWLFYLTGFW